MRSLSITIAAAALLATAGSARADLDLAVGVKWLPLNYTTPVSTSGSMAGTPVSTPLKGWNTTSINNYGGVFILDGKLGFLLGMDLGYSSQSVQVGSGASTDLSFTQFGFSLGAKYYFTKPAGGRVAPYAYFDFYKYFASVSTSVAVMPKGSEDFIGGLVSPLGINLAGGAEYFFTPSFSLGAEVLGLRYAYTFGETQMGSGFGAAPKVTETTHNVSFYTGLSLNYRFAIGARAEPPRREHERVRETDTDENAPPVRHKGPRELPHEERPEQQPPPTEPPPKEAEPVD